MKNKSNVGRFSSIVILVMLFINVQFLKGQAIITPQSVSNYEVTSIVSSTESIPDVRGFSTYTVFNTHIFTTAHLFNIYFGQSYVSPGVTAGASSNFLTGFTAGGHTFSRINSGDTKPFTKIELKRVNTPAYTGNTFSGFFTYNSVRDDLGNQNYNVKDNDLNVFIDTSPIYTMSELLNNFSLSYGTDNLFSNQEISTGNTGNNIERVDLVYAPGVSATSSTELSKIGLLLNERGGNDQFQIAAIKEVDVNGNVIALWDTKTVLSSAWGSATPSIPVSTVVFMGTEGQGNIRPKELVSMAVTPVPTSPITQNVAGLFISLEDLGVSVNETVYGFALFPGDISANYLTLQNTPLNTPADGTGGLDMMAGNFIAVRDDVLPVNLVSFGGKWIEDRVVLEWATSEEKLFEGFEVQHSNDLVQWKPKAFVTGTSGDSQSKNYSLYDTSSVFGVNYYRLKMIDRDQSYSYSKIVSVENRENVLVVYPNPVVDRIFVRGAKGELSRISSFEIRSSTGLLVKRAMGNDVGEEGIAVEGLNPGMYFLKVNYFNGYSKSYRVLISSKH